MDRARAPKEGTGTKVSLSCCGAASVVFVHPDIMLTADGGLTVDSCPDERDSFIRPVGWLANKTHQSKRSVVLEFYIKDSLGSLCFLVAIAPAVETEFAKKRTPAEGYQDLLVSVASNEGIGLLPDFALLTLAMSVLAMVARFNRLLQTLLTQLLNRDLVGSVKTTLRVTHPPQALPSQE
jgi:hypothetical protein